MATFYFSGTHKHSKKPVSGQVEAGDEGAARTQLNRRSIEVESLRLASRSARPWERLPLVLIGLGLAWQWAATRQPQAHSSRRPEQSLHLQVRARLEPVPADLDPEKLEVHLHFPEIPLDLTRRGRELAMDRQGRFIIEQDVKLRRRPRVVRVSCRAAGWRSVEFANLPVDEQSLSCQVPPIVLVRQAP